MEKKWGAEQGHRSSIAPRDRCETQDTKLLKLAWLSGFNPTIFDLIVSDNVTNYVTDEML